MYGGERDDQIKGGQQNGLRHCGKGSQAAEIGSRRLSPIAIIGGEENCSSCECFVANRPL